MTDPDRRHLHLLRHAKSSWDQPGLADHDRPLAPRGRRAADALAGHLPDLPAPPELVVCSSAARTTETLERIRPGLPDGVDVVVDPGVYHAWTGDLLGLVRALPSARTSVMLIGHNPGLHELACTLAGTGDRALVERLFHKYPTGALASLSFDTPWSALGPAAATLQAYVVPRDLEPERAAG